MFYRGQSYVSGPRTPVYFMRGMEGNHHHHGGHNPPPPPPPHGGFGTGGLTSFIFGGIAGAVLANVFDQKQVNAQAVPFPAQPMPVATPVPYYQPYFSQPMQGQMVNQGQPMQAQMVKQVQPAQIQSYGTLIGEPQMASSTQVIVKGQPMQTSFQSPNGGGMVPYSPQMQPMNPTFASSVPVPMQPMINAMPYYMFPVQSQPPMS